MADATIYGNIDQAYVKSRTTVAGTQTKSTTGMGSYQMGSSQIGFKGEEDLGSGLKASFLHEMGVFTEQNGSDLTRQAYVGLSGGFGAVRIGKQYSNAFGNLISADPFGATGGTGMLYVSNNMLIGNQGADGDNPLRQANAIQYDLPTFIPGVKIGVTKVFAGADTGNGSGAKTADSTGYVYVFVLVFTIVFVFTFVLVLVLVFVLVIVFVFVFILFCVFVFLSLSLTLTTTLTLQAG